MMLHPTVAAVCTDRFRSSSRKSRSRRSCRARCAAQAHNHNHNQTTRPFQSWLGSSSASRGQLGLRPPSARKARARWRRRVGFLLLPPAAHVFVCLCVFVCVFVRSCRSSTYSSSWRSLGGAATIAPQPTKQAQTNTRPSISRSGRALSSTTPSAASVSVRAHTPHAGTRT
jgi:hypothetical protein